MIEELPEGLLDSAEVLARLKISRSTLARYRRRGLLHARRLGTRLVRFTLAEVERLERGMPSADVRS